MRSINYIVLHCTATDQDAKTENIVKYWKEKLGWKHTGYHHLIESDGRVQNLQPISKPSNGVKGYNAHSIHISYIGGKNGDDRTDAQKKSMERLVKHYMRRFPDSKVQGHRDFPNVSKSCPSFDVAEWLESIL